MTLRASKPTLNIREALSSLRKKTGLFGEQVMRAETIDEYYSVVGTNKNLIINGGFDIWQRGTTGSVVGGPAYISADRWKCYVNTSTTITLSRQTFTPGQTEVPGNPTYYARFDWLGTASAQFFGFEHLIEGVHHGTGENLTISFYARTQQGDDMVLGVNQKFGTGGSADVNVANINVPLETFWKKFVFTIAVPSILGKTVGPNNCISLTWYRSGTLNSYLDIANVQVERGSVATPFERRHIGTELTLCQRYYQKSFPQEVAPVNGSTSVPNGAILRSVTPYNTTNSYTDTVEFGVVMRATPSITIYNVSAIGTPGAFAYYDGAWQAATATPVYNAKDTGFQIEPTGSFTAFVPRLGSFAYAASAEL